jgi:hypothetical protein
MVNIIERVTWGARYERGFGPAALPANEVWLHHSVTAMPPTNATVALESSAMRTLESIGEQRFGRGISYTFAVMPSGRVYDGHGVDRVGAHTANRNTIARAIVLVGNYDTERVTNAQVRSVAALLQHGYAARWWTRRTLNGGHQQAPGASTACPGRYAMSALSIINTLALGGPVEEDDVTFEDNDRRLLRELHVALISGERYGLNDIEESLGTPAKYRRDLGTIRNDVKAVGTQIAGVSGALTNGQAAILAAIAADATDQVDVDALAAALREQLGNELIDELVERLTT